MDGALVMAEEDWDLWAVVRSCNTHTTPSAATTATAITTTTMLIPFSSTATTVAATDYLTPRKHLIPMTHALAIEEKENAFEELDHIINPNVFPPFSRQLLIDREMTESPSKSNPMLVEPVIQEPLQSIPPSTPCHEKGRSHRVRVVEVEAENLPHVDPWNWRKYGRKPIKASQFPRNYYKCSSEGNRCNAKKHVERCQTHPEKYIVSYSGEHNHTPPSRRSMLSCTTRKKPFATRGDDFSSSSSAPPPSRPGGSKTMGEVGGDMENIYMGLENFGGGHRNRTVDRDFDWIWNTNDDLSFAELLSPPATKNSATVRLF